MGYTVLFIASIADGGHEGIADSLMKESRNVEKVIADSNGGLQPALPMGLFSAIGKYTDVQAKLKECAETSDQGPLILHFSSHGNDDDQSVRFEGNTDIKQFAQDIADAKPAVVVARCAFTANLTALPCPKLPTFSGFPSTRRRGTIASSTSGGP